MADLSQGTQISTSRRPAYNVGLAIRISELEAEIKRWRGVLARMRELIALERRRAARAEDSSRRAWCIAAR